MSPEVDTVELTLGEATDLAAGLVATTAGRLGIRALVIKGRYAAEQGLRAPRVALDVDVLVDPGHSPRLIAALAEHGWQPRPEDPDDAIFPTHSRSLIHRLWPCDIDVHTRFPGFEATPDQVFDAIWDARVEAVAAGVPVWIPSPTATLLIVALHSLRTPGKLNESSDLAHLVARARQVVDGSDVMDLVRRTDALGALAPFVRRAYPELVPDVVPPPSKEWILRSLAPDSATVRLINLRQARWRERPRLLVRALSPSRAALAAVNLDALATDTAGLRRLRRRRRFAALRRLPSIFGEYRAYQHEVSRLRRERRS